MIPLLSCAFLLTAFLSNPENKDNEARPAPEFPKVAAERWLNSPPLKLADMRGKVVLLDVWTFMCWNCTNSIPWVKEMHKRFASKDFLIIGIHTPEFEREKKIANVQEAVTKHGLANPQFIDNDYEYWRALKNRYWPAFYVVDKKGVIRHLAIGEVHVGDRRDREIQQIVQKLLEEE